MSDIALNGSVSGADIDDKSNNTKLLKTIKQEIKFYETKAGPWERKVKKIVRRYKDERSPRENENSRFNILWSNVQLLQPALYAKKPIPNIDRRNRIKDDLGRVSSMILERGISYFVDDKYDLAVRESVLDFLLTGRGTVWVRYEPKFEPSKPDDVMITEDVESEVYEKLSDENVCWDYVHMEDFGHSWGRVWDEVDIVWRRVYLDRQEIEERFPNINVDDINFDYTPQDSKDQKVDTVTKKATIYEAWNKKTNKAYWLHKDYDEGFLDEQDDPLNLRDFFPCPRPLFATLANDSCIPTPDYVLYQDQAIELDQLTGRIAAIVKSVKVAGVYDASAQGVQRLLSEGVENQLIPVDQWAMLAEKGGLQGVMALMPMQEILQTLVGLYDSRDKVKQDIYEITGLSDVMRGASDPNETYGAQRIKSQFGTLRLSARQDDVQRFCRELIYIGTQIIAKHFSEDTIKKISNLTLLSMQEKQLVVAHQQYAQQMQAYQQRAQHQPPQPGMMAPMPPIQPSPMPPYLLAINPDDMNELIDEPSWEEVLQFLKSDPLINYRIDIETDSTIKNDQMVDQAARVEFLQASGQFITAATQVQNPELAPLMAKMLMFGVRGFKIGRELEGTFEETIKKLEKQAQNPQQKPDPDMMRVQGQMQIEQQKLQNQMQIENAKLQADSQLKREQMQLDMQKAQADSQAEIRRLEMQAQVDTNQGRVDAELEKFKMETQQAFDQWKTKVDNETKITVANIQAQAGLQTAAISAASSANKGDDGDKEAAAQPDMMQQLLATTIQKLTEAFQGSQQTQMMMVQSANKPKQVIRDEQGNIIGVQ